MHPSNDSLLDELLDDLGETCRKFFVFCNVPQQAHHGPVCPPWTIRPIHSPGVSETPSSDTMATRCIPKPLWCLNTIVLYINLYLSAISRLLVMSVISSGTPNNIRSPNHITHITLYHLRTLSVRTLRVRELCRHDRDTSLVNNQ